jgi:hypothetical protein
MATIHEVTSARDGESFIALGPVKVVRQTNPKLSKNNKLYSTVILQNAASEVVLLLWERAAEWKLPIGETLTLRGKFNKSSYNGSASLNCDELSKPEGAMQVQPEDVQKAVEKPGIKECLDCGIRAADYVIRKERFELAEAAFAFAANARLQGARPE